MGMRITVMRSAGIDAMISCAGIMMYITEPAIPSSDGHVRLLVPAQSVLRWTCQLTLGEWRTGDLTQCCSWLQLLL